MPAAALGGTTAVRTRENAAQAETSQPLTVILSGMNTRTMPSPPAVSIGTGTVSLLPRRERSSAPEPFSGSSITGRAETGSVSPLPVSMMPGQHMHAPRNSRDISTMLSFLRRAAASERSFLGSSETSSMPVTAVGSAMPFCILSPKASASANTVPPAMSVARSSAR